MFELLSGPVKHCLDNYLSPGTMISVKTNRVSLIVSAVS